ncbi:hypothetical protein [Microbacterium hibisci]|uniref:hypothetical protein n=1 Tax=Microbacterium hibisci TaxID=2036000 RepID=UPI00194358BE|nr:hypothetical protein [Microbacterium hibisci]
MVGLSALAWLFPGESAELRGFGTRAQFTWVGLLILAAFYALAAGATSLGELVGRRVRLPRWLDGYVESVSREDEFNTRLYYLLTALAFLGVGYLVVAAGGPIAFVDAMIDTNANVLKAATGGQPGLSTLRYTAAIAAPLGVYRALSRRTGYASAIFNVVLLLISAIVASRLSLMMATVIFLYLIARKPIKIRARGAVVAVGVLFVGTALVFLNYIRNAAFYATNGVHDPISAAFFQALTYVGSPFQVSVGVANALAAQPELFASPTYQPFAVLLPSFLTDIPPGLPIGSQRYHDVVDIHLTLSTNSAFADTLVDYAVPGLLLSMVWVALFGFIFSFAARVQTYAYLTAGAALYGFAEFWRLLLMNQGVAIFAVAVPLLAAGIVALSFRIGWLDRVAERLFRQGRA